MSKQERRQLFAIQVAQEEEDRIRRQQQESLWQEQAAQENGFMFPLPHQWVPFPQDPNMMPPQPMEGQLIFPMPPNNPPPFLFSQSGPIQHLPFLDETHNPPLPFLDGTHNPPSFHPPMFNPPLPKQPLLPTPGQPLLHTPPLPSQPLLPTLNHPFVNQTPPHLPNQPHLLMPLFTPPLPSQPPPVSQPLPVVYPQDGFVQPQFMQPPLPAGLPTPTQPVFQTSLIPFPPLPKSPPAPVTPAAQPTVAPTAVPLPPKWKSAKDPKGRTYYYHSKLKVPQWIPPILEQQQIQTTQESESETESSDSEEEESSSEEEEQPQQPQAEDEEDKVEEEEPESVAMDVVNDDEDLGCRELGDSPYEPETMELLEDIVDEPKVRGRDALVQERIISPRTADEIPDKIDKRKIRELKEKIRREKAKQKAKDRARLKLKSKSKGRSSTNKCEADTSSTDVGRKIKDTFLQHMANVIVHYLNAYRKPDCKMGKITCTEDFKHLAKRLNHFVMLKELKHCRSVEELVCNDNVKHKARDFVKKYMAKFGPVYSRPADDD